MNWLTLNKLRGIQGLRKFLLVFFSFFSFAHVPLQLVATELDDKPVTIKLANNQPVILRASADYYDSNAVGKISFDWNFDEIIPILTRSFILKEFHGFNSYERNPFYTFNTASAP